jgi:hypothetical protein
MVSFGQQTYSLNEFEEIYRHEISSHTKRSHFSLFNFLENEMQWVIDWKECGLNYRIKGQTRGPSFTCHNPMKEINSYDVDEVSRKYSNGLGLSVNHHPSLSQDQIREQHSSILISDDNLLFRGAQKHHLRDESDQGN